MQECNLSSLRLLSFNNIEIFFCLGIGEIQFWNFSFFNLEYWNIKNNPKSNNFFFYKVCWLIITLPTFIIDFAIYNK